MIEHANHAKPAETPAQCEHTFSPPHPIDPAQVMPEPSGLSTVPEEYAAPESGETRPEQPPSPTNEERIERAETRIKALTGKLGIVQAQLLAMLADYYDVRREMLGSRRMDAAPRIEVERMNNESDEAFAHRRAMARRGVDTTAKAE